MLNTNVKTLVLTALLATMAIATPAAAEEPDAECASAVSAFAQEFGKTFAKESKTVRSDFKDMRNRCAALRKCKKECRHAKRDCKKDARGSKKDCKAECKSLKGKAKRDCKKQCRATAKGDKKECKGDKKECKNDCRDALLEPACKAGRRAFWKNIGNSLGKASSSAAKSKGAKVSAACAEIFSKN